MSTKLIFLLALCLATGMLMIACGGGADNTATTNTANTNAAKTNTATTNTAAANTSTTTASADKVGVAECDDFIAKYEACISGKVPAAAQATVKASLDTWRKSWKDLAANPSTKGTLAAACKQAAETAKTSMSAYGCAW
ncbi:MAG TPA: hypothetical protein VEX60_13745 [Pyrinomonadaceae bacterium]|nr:hypothetical protein [Pyrinomonadaceae bacterium]